MVQFRAVDHPARLLDVLACPLCRSRLDYAALGDDRGVLRCASCSTRAPVLASFPLFGERDLADATPDGEWLAALEARLFPPPPAYARHLRERAARGLRDRYAAFRPFNESSRTVLAFLALLRERLRPGDRILDTWNRTGWSGELLAGLFPQQHVVSLWEGDRDTLGYRGFRHWLPRGRRAPNLDLVFVDLHRERLPFADDAFACVHGLDTLHRYPSHTLLPELLRVSRPDAPLLFPHVHLTNAEPDPFFERGERQLHGTEWEARLTRAVGTQDTRAPLVLGERTLFEATALPCAAGAEPPSAAGTAPPSALGLRSDPRTPDYNALIGVVPGAWLGRPLASDALASDLAPLAAIPNPLLEVDLGDGALRVRDPEGILPRHPVYAERLAAGPRRLRDPLQRQLAYWAGRLPTLGAIAERLGAPPAALGPAANALAAAEVLALRRVSPACLALQRYQGAGELAPTADRDDLPTLWRRAVRLFGERPFLHDAGDGSAFSYAQADALVQATARRLRRAGVGAGDRLALWTALHVEAVVTAWAAAHLGATVVPLDPELAPAAAARLVARIAPRLVFVDPARAEHAAWEVPRVVFDGEDAPPGSDAPTPGPAAAPTFSPADPHPSTAPAPGPAAPSTAPPPLFADWLEDADFAAGPLEPSPSLAQQPGVVLFTSGTTGEPRGVVLDQQALAHSARLAARTFALTADDVYLGLGELHVMSGFRNTCLAVAHAGAAAVIAGEGVRRTPRALLACLAEQRVSVLGVVPAALRMLTAEARAATAPAEQDGASAELSRGGVHPRPGSPPALRLAVSTAAPLTESVRADFERAFGVPVQDYYGLTETAGLCAAEAPRQPGTPPAGFHPVDTLVRVVDAQGQDVPPDAPGELWLHSANLMRGYLDDPQATAAAFRDGWYRTGDLATLGPDGSLRLVGRLREVFKHPSGELVSTAAVEEALLTHPAVVDAGALVTQDEAGERLHAWVVPAPGAPVALLDALHAHLVERLGPKHTPTRLLTAAALPRNANGKLIHAQLAPQVGR